MTPPDVDRIAGDDLLQRHYLFLRYVLGERPLMDCFYMAAVSARAGVPLSVSDMEYVAARWETSDV